MRAALPQVINTPELRFDCAEDRKFAVVRGGEGAPAPRQGAKVQDVDGVRVLTEDGWWLLRASNTQAVLVARAEASSEAGLERLKAHWSQQLEASGLAAPDFSGSQRRALSTGAPSTRVPNAGAPRTDALSTGGGARGRR